MMHGATPEMEKAAKAGFDALHKSMMVKSHPMPKKLTTEPHSGQEYGGHKAVAHAVR